MVRAKAAYKLKHWILLILVKLISSNQTLKVFEIKFLSGATQTIESNKPIIFFENYAWHEDYANDRKVIAKLKSFGYTIYRLTVTSYKEDCIALHPNKHEKEINLLTSQTDIPYTKE